jgi:hypothetical protein
MGSKILFRPISFPEPAILGKEREAGWDNPLPEARNPG